MLFSIAATVPPETDPDSRWKRPQQPQFSAVQTELPSGVKAYYNGTLEINETYNRVTLDNQRKFTPPILLFTLGAIFVTFRSWRKTLISIVGTSTYRSCINTLTKTLFLSQLTNIALTGS